MTAAESLDLKMLSNQKLFDLIYEINKNQFDFIYRNMKNAGCIVIYFTKLNTYEGVKLH